MSQLKRVVLYYGDSKFNLREKDKIYTNRERNVSLALEAVANHCAQSPEGILYVRSQSQRTTIGQKDWEEDEVSGWFKCYVTVFIKHVDSIMEVWDEEEEEWE